MPRPKSADFLHNFRFQIQVLDFGGPGGSALLDRQTEGQVSAGFSAASTPEITQEAVEYREGHFVYTQKYVGLPTVSDITLSRGVALRDGAFWRWTKDVIEQGAEYRADLALIHFHRDLKPGGDTNTGGDPNADPVAAQTALETGTDSPGFIEYRMFDCFPIRFKPSSDLDATGSEVSVMEMDVAVERFGLRDHGPA